MGNSASSGEGGGSSDDCSSTTANALGCSGDTAKAIDFAMAAYSDDGCGAACNMTAVANDDARGVYDPK